MVERVPAARIVVFGDEGGAPAACRHIPRGDLAGVVASARRPPAVQALAALASERGAPLLVQPGRHTTDFSLFLAQLAALEPDVLLVNSYDQKLPAEVIALARIAAVNVHGGLLPEFRTAHPLQWAIVNGATETGVTLHHLSQTIDGGDIIARRVVGIAFDDTWRDVHARVVVAMDALLADELPAVIAGTASRAPQDETLSRTYPRRTREDDRIDWSASVRAIYNLIRARVHPHEGAFFVDATGHTVTEDRFLTISQVAAMKFGPAGGRRLELDGYEAAFVADDRRSPDTLQLRVTSCRADASPLTATICDISWAAGTARVAIESCGSTPLSVAAAAIARRAAVEELGLRLVDVH